MGKINISQEEWEKFQMFRETLPMLSDSLKQLISSWKIHSIYLVEEFNILPSDFRDMGECIEEVVELFRPLQDDFDFFDRDLDNQEYDCYEYDDEGNFLSNCDEDEDRDFPLWEDHDWREWQEGRFEERKWQEYKLKYKPKKMKIFIEDISDGKL